jgi:hypothetical protein
VLNNPIKLSLNSPPPHQRATFCPNSLIIAC